MDFWEKSIGLEVTVTREMIIEFAKLTGDAAPHHLSLVEANKIGYDDVLAQGLLIFSITGRLSSEYLSVINRGGVTYGYEKSRFIKPVYPNAILKFTYHPKIMRKNNILESEITVLNSSNETAFVTTHLLKII